MTLTAFVAATDLSWVAVPITTASDLSPFSSKSLSRNHRRTASVQLDRRLSAAVMLELVVADAERLDDVILLMT